MAPDQALHLWFSLGLDPRRPVQRTYSSDGDRRHRMGGDPPSVRAGTGRRRDRDGRRRQHDLNIRGAFLHMVGDAAISFGVVVTGAVIALTAWNWLDPLASLVISALIVWSTSGLLWESVKLSLAAVPEDIDQAKVEQYLRSLPGVAEVHDLHIWAMSTTETALTAHLVRPGAGLDDRLLHEAALGLDRNFRIRHATLQVEAGDTEEACRLRPAGLRA